MRQFIIASHHRMAEGLKDTLAFVTSRTEHVYAIAAYVDDALVLEDQIRELFGRFAPEDEVVVMTDLMSGSVNQKLYPYKNEHVHLIAGINLPAAIALLFLPEDRYLEAEDIRGVLAEARDQLVYINDCSGCEDEE